MTRLFLNLLNAPSLILLAAIGVALQTSLFASYPFNYLQPDVILIMILWCALKRSFFEGGVLTLILGNIAEIHSAAPQGMFLISYMAVYFLVRLGYRVLVIPNRFSLVIITMFISIIWKLIVLAILHLLGLSGNQWEHTLLFLFPGAVVEGLAAFWIFKGLERFDWITYKSARARQILEDELQLEGEGL